MSEFVLVYTPDRWNIVETETGEIVDYFKDEAEARETLEDWL